jgi:hypothetical protein
MLLACSSGALADSAAGSKKLPVPDAAAQTLANRTINDVFESQISRARTTDEKVTIVKKLVQGADDPANDTATRFMLLTRAQHIAADAGSTPATMAAIDRLDELFEIDVLRYRSDAVAMLARSIHNVPDRMALVTAIFPIIDAAIDAERFDIAKSLVSTATAQARMCNDTELIKASGEYTVRERAAESAHEEVVAANAVLAKNPADAEANLKVGKYRCFVKDDWETGLPLLARGSDTKIAAAAKSDTPTLTDPEKQVDLADAWWDLADKETGSARAAMQRRASHWYSAALPKLTGLEKVKVTKRLAELASVAPPAAAKAQLFSIASGDSWKDVSFSVEAGKCYQIDARGTWRGSIGEACGPVGLCPPELWVLLGPQPALKKQQKKDYYIGQHPRSALIARIGQEKWTFFVGDSCKFLAPVAGPLSFKINDVDDESSVRQGKMELSIKEIVPQWVAHDGTVEILGHLDATDTFHITTTGVYWVYGGSWARVGEHDGYYPTVINGIYWWPHWPERLKSDPLVVPALWPKHPEQFRIVKVEARRGGVKPPVISDNDIALTFHDDGLGSSQVGCVVFVGTGDMPPSGAPGAQPPAVLTSIDARLEQLREGQFTRPKRSPSPTTYLKAISSPGDFIAKGQTLEYSGDAVRGQTLRNSITVNVGTRQDGWEIHLGAPKGKALTVGEYPDAERWPFNTDSPGLDFSGHGHGSNTVAGKFVIWEMEIRGTKVVRLAADFIFHSQKTGPPVFGIIRINSSLE